MEIIPAIDILGGKCVRLTRGDYALSKVYDSNPVSVAMNFKELGFPMLHIVDLDGAKTGNPVNFEIVLEIVKQTGLTIQAGGGIRTERTLELLAGSGVSKFLVGSAPVKNREQFMRWIEKYGPERFIVCVDTKDDDVMVNGWIENGNVTIDGLISDLSELGIQEILCTDINRDGGMQGPAAELYSRLTSKYRHIKIIASGGVSGIPDLKHLESAGVFGVVIGKAIYEGRINLKELSNRYAN